MKGENFYLRYGLLFHFIAVAVATFGVSWLHLEQTTLLWLIFFAVTAVGIQHLADQETNRAEKKNALIEMNGLLRDILNRLERDSRPHL